LSGVRTEKKVAAKKKGETGQHTQTDGKEKIGADEPSLPAADCPVQGPRIK
jgi:hypothetical protein